MRSTIVFGVVFVSISCVYGLLSSLSRLLLEVLLGGVAGPCISPQLDSVMLHQLDRALVRSSSSGAILWRAGLAKVSPTFPQLLCAAHWSSSLADGASWAMHAATVSANVDGCRRLARLLMRASSALLPSGDDTLECDHEYR